MAAIIAEQSLIEPQPILQPPAPWTATWVCLMVKLPLNWIPDEPTMAPSQILTHSFSLKEPQIMK